MDRGRASALQLHQIGKDLGLTAKFVDDHAGWHEIVQRQRHGRRSASTSERKSPSLESGPFLLALVQHA
jgi:hypothetical protein